MFSENCLKMREANEWLNTQKKSEKKNLNCCSVNTRKVNWEWKFREKFQLAGGLICVVIEKF